MTLHPFLVNDIDYFNFYELQEKKLKFISQFLLIIKLWESPLKIVN